MKLYEINELVDNIIQAEIDEETGEISEKGIELLQALEMEKNDKCMSLVYVIKNIKAEAEAFKNEIDRLRKEKGYRDNKLESIKNYLRMNLKEGEKMNDDISSISWRKSESVQVDNVALLPAEFTKVTVEAKKNEIKAALKDGGQVAGCHLIKNNNMVIR